MNNTEWNSKFQITEYTIREIKSKVDITKLKKLINKKFTKSDLEQNLYKLGFQNQEFLLILEYAEKIYKYYRAINNDNRFNIDYSLSSLRLNKITDFYANDYIKPVINYSENIISVISDESEFKNHFAISFIILPYLDNNCLKQIEEELEILVEKYSMHNIHFTNIFGKKKILGQNKNRENFFVEYIDIINKYLSPEIPLSCRCISKSRKQILKELNVVELSHEEIYFSLFWKGFKEIVSGVKSNSIFHIYTEQEYSVNKSNYQVVVPKIFNKFYSGINQLSQSLSDKYISICKHPHFFSKSALFYSSLSDLIAYSSNKIQNKIDNNIHIDKIAKEYAILLRTIKSIFHDYSGLPGKELINLVNDA